MPVYSTGELYIFQLRYYFWHIVWGVTVVQSLVSPDLRCCGTLLHCSLYSLRVTPQLSIHILALIYLIAKIIICILVQLTIFSHATLSTLCCLSAKEWGNEDQSIPCQQINVIVCGRTHCFVETGKILTAYELNNWQQFCIRKTVSTVNVDVKRLKRKAEHLCSALHGIQTTLTRSGINHTAFNLQRTPCQHLPSKRSPDGASTKCGGGHLIAAHYSFIDPERMKGELAWLVDL